MQTTEQMIATVYAAFNRRDIDLVFIHMRPDVDWPNAMEGGREHGYDQVRAYWTRQWSMMDPRVEPVRVTEDGAGNTTVDVHQVVCDLAGNVVVDQMVQHVYSIRDGLIERMDIRDLPADPDQKR
jgi:hypothetical protein